MDVQESAPSAEPEISAVVEATATQGESQTAAPVESEPQSLLDAVKAAIEPKTEEAPQAEEAKPEEKAEETEAKAEEPEADDSKLPFHTHPRFKQLTTQRREFKERAEKAEQQLADLEPVKADAGHYQSIVTYMRDQNLTSPEVNEGFQIMAALKNDPLKALELLRPHYHNLQLFAGEILPDDLAAKAENGDVEEALARETARLRHAAEFERQKREQMEQDQRQHHQHHLQQQATTGMMQAVAQWEAGIKSSDPDFAKKQELVNAYIRAEAIAVQPRSPQEAVAIAQRAYEKANQTLAATRPAPTPARPTPSSASITGARPEPRTALEAAKLGLYGGR